MNSELTPTFPSVPRDDVDAMLERAYAPYSTHPVAAFAQVVSNDRQHTFSGVNVENIIDRLSVCAEQSLISNIISNCAMPFTIVSVEIYGPEGKPLAPCGACRQLLLEHCEPWTTINGKTIHEWLPDSPDIVL